ncbi:MAG TPA: hypothetical protein EYP14_16420 [Planctomycetaceae bacterium]|nr:hypothetical protein [Planctomycetaceae bacterium]
MVELLLSHELWKRIQPLLPPELPKPKGGRPRDSRPGLPDGHLLGSVDGNPLGGLAPGTGSGSGMTCWRRLRDGQKAGVWKKIGDGSVENRKGD